VGIAMRCKLEITPTSSQLFLILAEFLLRMQQKLVFPSFTSKFEHRL